MQAERLWLKIKGNKSAGSDLAWSSQFRNGLERPLSLIGPANTGLNKRKGEKR